MYFHSKSLSSFAAPPSGSVGLCSLKLVWFVGKSLLMVEYIYLAVLCDYIAVHNCL